MPLPYTSKTAPVRNVLPNAALKKWVEVFNSVWAKTKDKTKARTAAWGVTKLRYKPGKGKVWVAKKKEQDDDYITIRFQLPVIQGQFPHDDKKKKEKSKKKDSKGATCK